MPVQFISLQFISHVIKWVLGLHTNIETSGELKGPLPPKLDCASKEINCFSEYGVEKIFEIG